jgi:hypothetical protein
MAFGLVKPVTEVTVLCPGWDVFRPRELVAMMGTGGQRPLQMVGQNYRTCMA